MRKNQWIGVACGAIGFAVIGGIQRTQAAITVNGTLDPAFGSALSYAQVPTSADDSTTTDPNDVPAYGNGSEIDAAYATIQNDINNIPTLYLFFAGNINTTNGDNFDVFIQTGTGGSNPPARLSGDASPGKYDRLVHLGSNRGLTFDNGFNPNYFFTMQAFGSNPTDSVNQDFNIYSNYANINTGASGYLGNSKPTIGTLTGSTSMGVEATYDDSNTAGVTGTSVPSQSALAAITTGVEFSIPLSDITEAGQTLSTIEFTALITDTGGDNVYNQVTGLESGFPGSSPGDSSSLGDPTYATGTNFNNDAGLQYLSISVPAVPEPLSIGLLAVAGIPLLARRRR
jgi:hypothetical protein